MTLVEAMVAAWPSAPVAYALDVGVLSTGETALVEVNDFWAIGCYGFEGLPLLPMLTQRYREIQRNKTTYVLGVNSHE
jgi:hypothetical protein